VDCGPMSLKSLSGVSDGIVEVSGSIPLGSTI